MRVLVLVVDGLQAAYLGPYGNEWIDTPTLDQWAAAGVVLMRVGHVQTVDYSLGALH